MEWQYELVSPLHVYRCSDPWFLSQMNRIMANIFLTEWFPMRVTYQRELILKASLDALGIENFVPMHYEIVGKDDHRKCVLVPAIHNLIFVRTSQKELTELKMTRRELSPLRYIMKPSQVKGKMEIIRVPDRQMENFMRVACVEDERVKFLEYGDFLSQPGKRVRIADGFFAGVEGVIKRIRNNKHVVVQIDGVAAVAITYVPKQSLMAII